MKTFTAKFEIGEKVYVLSEKKEIHTEIIKVRILHQAPYKKMIEDSPVRPTKFEYIDMDGLEIEYLILKRATEYGNKGSTFQVYDWYKEEDIFKTKEELIGQIV